MKKKQKDTQMDRWRQTDVDVRKMERQTDRQIDRDKQMWIYIDR